MIRHYFCLGGDISRGEVGDFKGLRFYPAKGFKVLEQKVILRKLRRQFNAVVAASLRNPGYGLQRETESEKQDHRRSRTHLNLLHLLVVRRRDTIQECRYLGSEISSSDERAEDILGQNICI